MKTRFLLTVVTAATLAGSASAQMQRRATIVGGGNPEMGRCTGEVVVDGAAQVEIRGDMATLRDLSGQPPRWQRFDCTSPMPATANVRLSASGRGRAELVSAPRDGAPAVVRIEDPEGGADVYRFELSWNSGQGYQSNSNQGYSGYSAYGERREGDRGDWQNRRPYGSDQAVQVCRDAVRQQAMDRFGTQDINIRRINIDDQPGRGDRVVGMMEVRQYGREDHLPFSCSVNLDTGRVRTAQIDAPNMGSAARDISAREMDTCRNAVSNRMGGQRVEFGQMSIDSRNDTDVVTGSARSGWRSVDFSCWVSPYSGNVRNVDIRRR